jgi:monoamine oxidase
VGTARGRAFGELLKPEGSMRLHGKHLSYIGLWEEGPALSVHEALKLRHFMAAE